MMKVIIHLYEQAKRLITAGVPIAGITESGMTEKLIKMKYEIPNDDFSAFDAYIAEIDRLISDLLVKERG